MNADEMRPALDRTSMEVSFFLGAVSMLDILFRDEIHDGSLHKWYVLDLCESSAPRIPYEQAGELIIGRVPEPARTWVRTWYGMRANMS